MRLPTNSYGVQPDFKSNQIVCLEQANGVLYAEVVQNLPQRQRCWVRPRWFMLGETVYALDDRAPDLLWPSQDFRAAFDEEVLPLIGEPLTPNRSAEGIQNLRQWMHGLKPDSE